MTESWLDERNEQIKFLEERLGRRLVPDEVFDIEVSMLRKEFAKSFSCFSEIQLSKIYPFSWQHNKREDDDDEG
jgi:hypothetical protein